MNAVKNQNEKIDTRGLTSIVIFIITLKSQNYNTIPLFQTGLTATWVYPMIWFLIFIIIFPIFSKVLSKFNNKGLFEINEILLGRFIGSLFNLLFIFILFITVLYGSKYYVNYLNLWMFPKTPTFFLYILILFTSYYIAKGGIESIGRIAWIFIPYYIFANLLLIFLVLKGSFTTDILFPILGNGLNHTLWNAIKSSCFFGEFIVLAYIIPLLKDYKSYKLSNFVGLSISTLLILFIFLSYLMALDYRAPQEVLNIYYELIVSTEELAQFNIIYLSIWVSAGIIRFSYYLFSLSFIIGKLFKITNYKKIILPITAILILVSLIPQDPYLDMQILSRIMSNYLWPVFILLPILLWILVKRRGDKIENN